MWGIRKISCSLSIKNGKKTDFSWINRKYQLNWKYGMKNELGNSLLSKNRMALNGNGMNFNSSRLFSSSLSNWFGYSNEKNQKKSFGKKQEKSFNDNNNNNNKKRNEEEEEQEEEEEGEGEEEEEGKMSKTAKEKFFKAGEEKKLGQNWFPCNYEIPAKSDAMIRLVSEVPIKLGDPFKRDKWVDDVEATSGLSDEQFISTHKPMREVSKLVPLHKALIMARERRMDLIAVAKDQQGLFICREEVFRDFMKDLRNKEKKKKKKGTRIQKIKEIMISVNIADHDLATKTNAIRRVLSKGDQARVIISFAKKEVADLRLANGILDLILVHVQDLGKRDATPLKVTPKNSGDFVACFFFPTKSKSELLVLKEKYAEDREEKKKKGARREERKKNTKEGGEDLEDDEDEDEK